MNQQVALTRQALKTPRAAAVAGIIFAVLFTTSLVLIRLAFPEDLRGTNIATWLQGNTTTISLALTLVPFAGIAFLWFMGVVRDRLGTLEDQFFSTVFFGSGLLFLAMIFASAAIAGGIIASYAIEADTLTKSGVITLGRAIMYTITNVYAIRMAGVFMISLATIWIRTRLMPRVFVYLTYPLALVLLVSSNLSLWLILVFPAWVFVISMFILIESLRGELTEAEGVVGSNESP
jgi:MFS family permease